MTPSLSIVIPIYSERENLPELRRRLDSALDGVGDDFEIVFVDDRSKDDSFDILRRMAAEDPRVKVVRLARNFGHQLAITAGLHYASGRSVVIMDGDLQDPPEVIPDLLAKKSEGAWDVVYAVRRKRQGRLLIRALYHVYYRMLKRTSYIDIPIDAGDFCVMDRRVVDWLNRMPERNRFVRGLRSWIGLRQVGLEYDRAARGAGSPKYTIRALFKLALDGVFSFSYIPLRLSTFLGLTLSLAGLIYAFYIVLGRIQGRFATLGGWPTVVVSVLVLGGVQLVMLGIMGEYLGRIYEEIKGRPQYVVDETVGFVNAGDRAESAPPDADPAKQ